MTRTELLNWFEHNDGVVGVTEFAAFIGEGENGVRRYARENGLRRIGSTFVFTFEDAVDFLDEESDDLEEGDNDDGADDDDAEDNDSDDDDDDENDDDEND